MIRPEQELARAYLLRDDGNGKGQIQGRVNHVCVPRGGRLRIVVGTLRTYMQGENGRVMLIPSNRALPYFVVPRAAERYLLPRGREAGGGVKEAAAPVAPLLPPQRSRVGSSGRSTISHPG